MRFTVDGGGELAVVLARDTEPPGVDLTRAGDADLLGRSTVSAIVHEHGGRLIAAQRQRARATRDAASEAERAALGSSLADEPESMPASEPDDDPPLDPEDPQWQQAPPAWVVTGFPGCDPSPPVRGRSPAWGTTRW